MDLWLLGALIYATVGVTVALASPKEHERVLLLVFGMGTLIGGVLFAAFKG